MGTGIEQGTLVQVMDYGGVLVLVPLPGDPVAALEATTIVFLPVGRELVLYAAAIKARHPVTYADAHAAGLAQLEGATVVTGDPEFQELEDAVPIRWLSP